MTGARRLSPDRPLADRFDEIDHSAERIVSVGTKIVPIVRIKVARFHGIMRHDWGRRFVGQDRAQCRRARSAYLATVVGTPQGA